MNLIDILILIFCIAGLGCFAFERIKYSNKNVYYQKLERYVKLQKRIQILLINNEEAETIIQNINNYDDFNGAVDGRLIEYRDNEEKLALYKDEFKKLESYLKKARHYIKDKLYE